MYELRLLGGTECRDGTGTEVGAVLAHPKRFALFAYLAAARPFGWQRRDSLVALLWPELDQTHARTALRKSVHRLRQTLGAEAFIARGDESIEIAPSAVWCDVRAFREALAVDHPEQAIALYRGEFLPGLFVADAPEFERWVERERDDLLRSAVDAAWRAADAAERAGSATQCTAFARRAVELAPDDERAARRLISLLDRIGDRAGALRVYEGLARHLATDLQVTPSAETQTLVAAVRSAAARRGADTADAAPADGGVRHGPMLAGERATAERATAGNAAEDRETRMARLRTTRARPRLLWLGTLAALIVASAMIFAPPRLPVDARLDERRVAVFALENETGRPDLGFVGMEVQDWIARGLQETALVRVLPFDASLVSLPTSTTSASVPGRVRQAAVDLGAATLVRGRYYLRGDSILLQVSIIGVRDDDVVATIGPISAAITNPTPAVERVRERTVAAVASHIDPAMKDWAHAASQPPSFEAYREFWEGTQAVNRDDYAGAVGHYLRAAALDSAYVFPLLKAAEIQGMGLHNETAEDSLLRMARRRSASFAPVDDAYAGVLEAGLAGDFERQLTQARRLRRYVPAGGDMDLGVAAAAVAMNRPREAFELAKAVDLTRPAMLDHWSTFVPIINAYHLAGEDEALVARLRKEAARWRHIPVIVVGEVEALGALARGTEAVAVWRRLLPARTDEEGAGAMWAAAAGARELRAHGETSAARAMAAEALDSFPVALPRSDHFPGPRVLRMQLLREAGRPRDAWEIAHSLAARDPRNIDMLVTAAALSAQVGDTAPARQLEATLSGSNAVSAQPRGWLARARLLAALGRPDSAVALIRSGCAHGCEVFEDLHSIPEFDALRSYAGFTDFLRPKQ